MAEKKDQKNIKSQVDNITKGTILGMYVSRIKALYNKSPKVITIVLALTALVLVYAFGYIECLIEGYHEVGIINIFVEWITGLSLVVSAVVYVAILIVYYFAYTFGHSGQIYDEKRDYIASETGTAGTAKAMTEEEKEKAFDKGNFATNDNIILGQDVKTKEMYSVKEAYGVNGNIAIFGSPGSGKSRCFIIPAIFNKIRKGESMIITDPKGELYGKTAELARAHGYTVKIFNAHPEQMLHSDGVDFMKVIGDNEFKINAFVDTVMVNITGNVDKEFWDKSQMNELKFITTYVATNNVGIPKTLGGVYHVLNTKSVDELEDLFFNLPEDHPAMPAFRTWAQGDKVVKGNTHGGLQVDLQNLANPLVQKITGTDEIDLTLPGREKCIYYVAMSDQDRSQQWLVALFFTFLFKELVSYADKTKKRRLPIKVTFLLDEFYNIGLIPDFDSKISQVRSRNIDCAIILQSLGQLQKMYPDNVWESVIDCCSTMMLLATRSLLTAKYFSEYSGEQTVISTSYNHEKLKGTEDHGVWVSTRTTETKRFLYTPHEVLTKDKDHILVSTSTFNMCEVEKVDYARHPMCKEIREVVASEHIPDWVRNLDEYEKEELKVSEEKFTEEGGWDIELCTEEDFEEEWTNEKEERLQIEILKKKKELGRCDEEDEEELERLGLLEDYEEEGGFVEDAKLSKEEKESNGSKAKLNPNTGRYEKSEVVHTTTFVSESSVTTYVDMDHQISAEEHERLQAAKKASVSNKPQTAPSDRESIQDKMSRLFDDDEE